MRKEFLNIWILENHEAEERLGHKIINREKLHHWPLSWVEKWTLDNGEIVVYKSQCSAASVQKAVYETVQAPFLLPLLYAESCRGCDMLLFPYCPPSDETIDLSASALMKLTYQCSKWLQEIDSMPVFFDLFSPEKLILQTENVCRTTLEKRHPTELSHFFNWLETQAPRFYANESIGYVHGDIHVSNLVWQSDTVRYILDWQRPMLAPLALEQALAFRLAGYNMPDKIWESLALVCHLLWFSWAYGHVLPIPPVQQTAEKLLQAWAEKSGN